MLRQVYRWAREKLSGEVDIQKLMDRNSIKMYKSSPFRAEDLDGEPMCWFYRFTFDNHARKRRFMHAVENYSAQPWDPWVRWMNDISYAPISFKAGEDDNKICVEAHCRVPPAKTSEFMYNFERFVTRNLILKD